MNLAIYETYAKVLLSIGVDLQVGQNLYAEIPVEQGEFARILTRIAYRDYGARYVKIAYTDGEVRRIMLEEAQEQYLGDYPTWEGEMLEALSSSETAYLRVGTVEQSSPVDPKRLAAERSGWFKSVRGYRENMNNLKISWCSVIFPTLGWAKLVYPELEPQAALSALWSDFLKINRLDCADPLGAWKAHRQSLETRRDALDALEIKSLHFLGDNIDLQVPLVEGGNWVGGSVFTIAGQNRFMPNLPTEEIFHIPRKYQVQGWVRATMPLNYNGQIIEDLELRFVDGQVVEYGASSNEAVLAAILATDEGTRYLGEVALVPVSSPIYQSGRIFNTTLYDENAVCHLALGNFASSVTKTAGLSESELDARGINTSLLHVDFMVGSSSLKVTALCEDGSVCTVMENGEFRPINGGGFVK